MGAAARSAHGWRWHRRQAGPIGVTDGEVTVVFTGDVLFNGTIGRTDLPGGSMEQMRESLARIAASFPPEVPLLPGHGEPTTLAAELSANPYLQNL